MLCWLAAFAFAQEEGGHGGTSFVREGTGVAHLVELDLDDDRVRTLEHRLALAFTLDGTAARDGWRPSRQVGDFRVTAVHASTSAGHLVREVIRATEADLPGKRLLTLAADDGRAGEPTANSAAEVLAVRAWSASPSGFGLAFPHEPAAVGAAWTVPSAVRPIGDNLRLDVVTTFELVGHTPKTWPRPGQPATPPPTAQVRWRAQLTGTGQVLAPGGEPTALRLDPAIGGGSGDLLLDLETGGWTGRIEWKVAGPLTLPDGRVLTLDWFEQRTGADVQ